MLKPLILYSLLTLFMVACEESPLPSINLVLEKELNDRSKEDCWLIYKDKEVQLRLDAGIKKRGGFSSRYEKSSYSLELASKYKLANLSFDDDWILNASYIDKTFLRHKFSYDLFREMGPMNEASRSSYIELYINDAYEGLYLIMEELNANRLMLDKSDSMSVLFKDPPLFYYDRIASPQDENNYYQQKYPKKDKRDMSLYIEELKDFLFNSSDAEFSGSIDAWFDINNVIDWHIILLLSNNNDGIMKNFYLYKQDGNTPFRFAIWDYDHSYGRDGDNELNMLDRELNCRRSILLDRLMSVESTNYPQRLKSRWHQLRNSGLFSAQAFRVRIDDARSYFDPAIERNSIRWPIDSDWYYDENDFGQELEIIYDFLDMRLEQLDKSFEYF